jgi:hypothetical protein
MGSIYDVDGAVSFYEKLNPGFYESERCRYQDRNLSLLTEYE